MCSSLGSPREPKGPSSQHLPGHFPSPRPGARLCVQGCVSEPPVLPVQRLASEIGIVKPEIRRAEESGVWRCRRGRKGPWGGQ